MSDGARAVPAWRPQAVALREHWQGARGGVLEVLDHTGDVDPVEVAHFFREGDELTPCDRAALAAVRGRVLDLGAAAGAHALPLQAAGHAVTALEVEPLGVELLRARGLADVRLGGLEAVAADGAGAFDTVLLLMHGAGLGGDLEGLHALLVGARHLLAPGGQVLVDSRDPGDGGAAVAELRLRFGDLLGAPFEWLFLSEAALAEAAGEAGLAARVLWRDGDHHLQALTAG